VTEKNLIYLVASTKRPILTSVEKTFADLILIMTDHLQTTNS